MKRSFIDILIRPGAFFSDLSAENEDFKWPLLIVLAGGIIAAGYGYMIGETSAKMMAGSLAGLEGVVPIATAVSSLVGVFIFWIVWAAVIYILSMVFKGDGSFNRTLQAIGYGFLPQVIGSLITLVVAIEYVPKIAVPHITNAMMQNPALMDAAMKSFMHDPAMVEMTQITSLVTIVFLLWSANIWIFGLQHARKLSPRDAALCVGIPVILYILYLIYTLGVS